MKQVANPYEALMLDIFKLKKPVRLFSEESLIQIDTDIDESPIFEICGVIWPASFTGRKYHTIILADNHSDTLESYLSVLTHEYVHAWQDENGFNTSHTEASQFRKWRRYLLKYYGIRI